MTKLINQETFIIDAGVREEHLHRVEVLEKVKGLLLLPNTGYATTQQVADFYEVNKTVIGTLVFEHKDELVSDGYQIVGGKELKEQLANQVSCKAKITNKRGHWILEDGETTHKFSYTPNALFPRRAILRVGMLLRDSEIAKEVRTQLLNIEEKVTNEVKVRDVNEELALQAAVDAAYRSGDINEFAAATTNLIAYMKRYHAEEQQQKDNKITEQRTVIKALAKEEVQYKSPSKLLHSLVKRYGAVVYGSVSTGRDWNDLCHHLVNKLGTGINLKARKSRVIKAGQKHATLLSVIRPEEFEVIIPAMVGLCENRGVDVSDIMKDA